MDVRNLLLLATGEIKIYVQRTSDNSRYALFSAEGIDSSQGGYLKFNNLSLDQSGSNLQRFRDVLIVIAKTPGTQIRGLSLPTFPANSTGVYDFQYDSSTQVISWTPPKARLQLRSVNTSAGTVNWTVSYTTTATSISLATSNSRIILDADKVYRMTYGHYQVMGGVLDIYLTLKDNSTALDMTDFDRVGNSIAFQYPSSVTFFIKRSDIPSGTDRIYFSHVGATGANWYVTIEEV